MLAVLAIASLITIPLCLFIGSFFFLPRPFRKQLLQAPVVDSWLYKSHRQTFHGLSYIHLHSGSGRRPIVLLHGLGSSYYSWEALVSYLQGHELLLINLAGFGGSKVPENFSMNLKAHSSSVLDLLDHLNMEDCYFVGCSMGATISLYIQSIRPDKAPKVLGLSPAVFPTWLPIPFRFLYGVAQLFPQWLIDLSLYIAIWRSTTTKNHPSLRQWTAYRSFFRSPDALKSFFYSQSVLQDSDLHRLYNKDESSAKSLLVWAKKDRVLSRRPVEKLLINPNYQCKVHPWGGHHLMEDDPKWVAEEIEHFFFTQS